MAGVRLKAPVQMGEQQGERIVAAQRILVRQIVQQKLDQPDGLIADLAGKFFILQRPIPNAFQEEPEHGREMVSGLAMIVPKSLRSSVLPSALAVSWTVCSYGSRASISQM